MGYLGEIQLPEHVEAVIEPGEVPAEPVVIQRLGVEAISDASFPKEDEVLQRAVRLSNTEALSALRLVRPDGPALHGARIFYHLSFFVPFYWWRHGWVGAFIALYPDPLIHLS
jgi:hypothetical protein